MRSRAPWLAVLVVAMSCGGAERPAPSAPLPVPAGAGESILFVGNSLTYANDLPGMVEGLAAAVGVRLPTAQVAHGGYSLADHLDAGDAARAIAAGGWRVVILQQGPSGQPDSRRLLRRDTVAFDRLIREAGARTALFSVWADSHGPSSFAEVRESYSLAAADVNALYFPVNEAWTLARDGNPDLRLYSDDGFHPSQEGSYLAALVIASALTGISPSHMPASFARPDGSRVVIATADASALRACAAAASQADRKAR